MEKARNIKVLKVFGDSDLILQQITNQCLGKNPSLKHYHNEAWDLIELFNAFSITTNPREENIVPHLLVVSTLKLQHLLWMMLREK